MKTSTQKISTHICELKCCFNKQTSEKLSGDIKMYILMTSVIESLLRWGCLSEKT